MSLGLADSERRENEPDLTDAVATATFCSAQRLDGKIWINDLAVVEAEFRAGWPTPVGQRWALVLVDMRFGDDNRFGLDIIQRLRSISPRGELGIVVVSTLDQFSEVARQGGGESLRSAAERVGADDFLALASLGSVVEDVRATPAQLKDRLWFMGLTPDNRDRPEIIGRSLAMLKVLRDVRSAAADPVGTLLVTGEMGSGKTHLVGYLSWALAMGAGRQKKRGPGASPVVVEYQFGPVGLDLQQVALFGTGGATGVDPRPGAFEACADGGLIVLDEIHEAHMNLQAGELKLALEPRSDGAQRFRLYFRTGSKKEYRSQCFVMAATNADLAELVELGKFKRDVFDRISARTVRMPTLAERQDDVPLLVEHALKTACRVLSVTTPMKVEELPVDWWLARVPNVRQMYRQFQVVVSNNRYSREITAALFDSLQSIRVSDFNPETLLVVAPPDSARPLVREPSDFIAQLRDLVPSTPSNPDSYRGVMRDLDIATARAQLAMLAAFLAAQKGWIGREDLTNAFRVLLDDKSVGAWVPSREIKKLFNSAGISARPDDVGIAALWDRLGLITD